MLGIVAGSVASAAPRLDQRSTAPAAPAPRGPRDLLELRRPAHVAGHDQLGRLLQRRLRDRRSAPGPLQTGYYYRAYTLAVEYQSKLAVVMNQVGFPVLARTSNKAELTQLYRQMIRLLTIVLFPPLVLLTIAAPVIVPFVFGARWDPAVVPVQILAVGGASTIVFNAVKTVWMSTGRVGVPSGSDGGSSSCMESRCIRRPARYHRGRDRRCGGPRAVRDPRLQPDAARLRRASGTASVERHRACDRSPVWASSRSRCRRASP